MTKATAVRPQKPPPMVSIKHLREAHGWSLEEVGNRIYDLTGRRHSKGTLSAVEIGMRGASWELLEALEIAYGLPAHEIKTDYQPKARRGPKVAE
jgi:transcriptional regulator with XRE-family HTH domain